MHALTRCASGLASLPRRGNWFLTMKWSKRIAQGFSPGLDRKKRALKVAPDVWAWSADRRTNNPNMRFGRHFSSFVPVSPKTTADRQGASCGVTPRAKALGYSLRPFHGQNRLATTACPGSLIEQYFHGIQPFSSIDSDLTPTKARIEAEDASPARESVA